MQFAVALIPLERVVGVRVRVLEHVVLDAHTGRRPLNVDSRAATALDGVSNNIETGNAGGGHAGGCEDVTGNRDGTCARVDCDAVHAGLPSFRIEVGSTNADVAGSPVDLHHIRGVVAVEIVGVERDVAR